MKLWDLPKNESATVENINQIAKDQDRERLRTLGFDPGEKITCLQQPPFGGPRVYRNGDSVFSLAVEVASCVVVTVGGERS